MKKTVLLVTSSDDTQDLIQLMLESLENYQDPYPKVGAFLGATLKRRSSVEAAMRELGPRDGAVEADPVLIVLDAFVRDSNEVARADGTAASRLLTWLEKHKPTVPVLISSPTSVERLDLKVLGRRDVGLWSLTAAQTADHVLRFVDTVAGLLPPYQPQQRRITVEVGVSSARYRIRDGHYEFNTDWIPYGRPKMLQFLVSATEEFSPFGPDGTQRSDWQHVLRDYGNRLFDLLLNDTLGPAMLKLISEVQITESNPGYEVDLRFDIDLSENEGEAEPLFTLPFEVVNHDFEVDSFLCARVPMARRLNLANPHQRTKLDGLTMQDLMRDRKLKVLFLDASASGNVKLVDDNGIVIKELQRLDELNNTKEEQAVLETFARTASTMIEMPHVIEGSKMSAAELIDCVRDKLINGGFDVFHYSGHSISLGKGGTFLIFPDGEKRARAISVRAVADWVSKGSCRLVVLSSCRGASLRTAIETMKAGAEAVLGFRWDVADDDACIDYFRRFYAAYLSEGHSLSRAYCEACREVRTISPGKPIWASAVAVVRD